jgi:parallel beta-helix repeat protein
MVRGLMIVFFIILLFFQTSVMAQPCTMYMVSTLSSHHIHSSTPLSESSAATPVLISTKVQSKTLTEYNDINEALLNSTSGEVICFKAGIYPSITIENIQGGVNNITLKAQTDTQVKILHNSYSGTGIVINNSKNIVISGFTLFGGLYGIYAKGSSDLTIINNTIHNVGQEGIVVKSGIAMQPLSNFIIADNIISGTGKSLPQYGEGIYVGDGNDNFNEIINQVTIENNNISNTMNEAIDIKINTQDVIIHSNNILNTNLKFNGAITVATSARYGADSNITISNNNIIGVVNRSGYRAIGIAVGQGNSLITSNMISEVSTNFVGICLFSTFVNDDANEVTLGDNYMLTNGIRFLANCGHGGTGVHALATVIEMVP